MSTAGLSNTNIAGIGGAEDLAQRVAAAKTEVEWTTAGKKEGIEIWRIENFGVKKWPPERYGEFYSGDCYIVLETYGHERSYSWNVYYWIGLESTIDEKGTAALKTIELDDLLGMRPVQYRETQGHESEKFLELFKGGIRILKGGIDSGFKHVEKEKHTNRLLQVKGAKNVRAYEVPCTYESLNYGDVFILDTEKRIYVWIPKKASHNEKFKASQVANDIKSSKRGKCDIVRTTGGGTPGFWENLGGKGDIKKSTEVESDREHDQNIHKKFPKKMYQLSDEETGKLEFKLIEEVGRKGYLTKKKLISDDVMIIDNGLDIIAWIGKGANKDERKNAILYATNYIGMAKKPEWTRITRIEEGREGKKFWELSPTLFIYILINILFYKRIFI